MISTHDYVGNPTDEQKAFCEKIREAFKAVESVIPDYTEVVDRTFSRRCFLLARTHLEIAAMYSIKGVVFEGKEVKGYGA